MPDRERYYIYIPTYYIIMVLKTKRTGFRLPAAPEDSHSSQIWAFQYILYSAQLYSTLFYCTSSMYVHIYVNKGEGGFSLSPKRPLYINNVIHTYTYSPRPCYTGWPYNIGPSHAKTQELSVGTGSWHETSASWYMG